MGTVDPLRKHTRMLGGGRGGGGGAGGQPCVGLESHLEDGRVYGRVGNRPWQCGVPVARVQLYLYFSGETCITDHPYFTVFISSIQMVSFTGSKKQTAINRMTIPGCARITDHGQRTLKSQHTLCWHTHMRRTSVSVYLFHAGYHSREIHWEDTRQLRYFLP